MTLNPEIQNSAPVVSQGTGERQFSRRIKAVEVFAQNDGAVTKAYYERLGGFGPAGRIAVALFRAQKRSAAAKKYRGRRFKSAAYDVKQWSMEQLCAELEAAEGVIPYGWKEDPNTLFGERASWVLYVDLPQGQVSFHSPLRGKGPDYQGEWDGQHKSAERIIEYCDAVEDYDS